MIRGIVIGAIVTALVMFSITPPLRCASVTGTSGFAVVCR